jgi:DNA-binding CsgD family transcriptional regulator
MSSTRKQQLAERVLDSIRTRFSKDVSNAWNGFGVSSQLHAPATPGSDQEALFKRNHELFRSGLDAWTESLVKTTQEWVSRLARIASRDPSLATDDPARWARCRVQEMLGKGLGIVVIGPDAAVPPSFHVKKVRSAIERWIMHICDNGPDFDRSESGYHEPWCAPVWGQKNFMISFWIRKGRPDRLTVEQTVLEVRSAENMFIGRLDYVLGDAEDQARVDLVEEYQQGSHSIASIAGAQSDSTSTPPIQRETQSPVADTTADLKTPAPKLPPKKNDLSRYLEGANLTPKQYECASLKWEYEIPVTEIARRQHITRKTVDEHLAAAHKKMDTSRSSEKRARDKAKSGIC